jgi:hypothetical protein
LARFSFGGDDDEDEVSGVGADAVGVDVSVVFDGFLSRQNRLARHLSALVSGDRSMMSSAWLNRISISVI